MLFRKVESKIQNWLDNGSNALLVTGARQIGKTYIIRDCLEKNNLNYVEFNFLENKEIVETLKTVNEKSSLSFINKLGLLTDKKLKPGMVIFLDEVQEFKEIVTIIKFLVDDGTFRYVLSGSLLGVELINLKSAPVGYLTTIMMYPMDFEEFIIACGINKIIIENIYDSYKNLSVVDNVVHSKMIEIFKNYLVVGGMPSVVQKFVDTGNFQAVSDLQKDIINLYLGDFTKYETKSNLKLKKIYNDIPSELASKNMRFVFTNIDKNFKFDRYENSFNWLIDAGVAIPSFNVTEARLPLEINKKNNLFKFFLSDIGLLSELYGRSTKLSILNNKTSLNAGAIYENVIAIELNSHAYKPYYLNSKKYGEVDFIIERNEEVLPIEVKSGKDYEKHNALDKLMSNTAYGIKKSYVLADTNVKVDSNIIYLPIYMIMFIDEAREEQLPTAKIDLSDLVWEK